MSKMELETKFLGTISLINTSSIQLDVYHHQNNSSADNNTLAEKTKPKRAESGRKIEGSWVFSLLFWFSLTSFYIKVNTEMPLWSSLSNFSSGATTSSKTTLGLLTLSLTITITMKYCKAGVVMLSLTFCFIMLSNIMLSNIMLSVKMPCVTMLRVAFSC